MHARAAAPRDTVSIEAVTFEAPALPEDGERPVVWVPEEATEQDRAVGRLGERCVFDRLRAERPSRPVVWVNEHEEQGWPFDIVVGAASVEALVDAPEELLRSGLEFIEVKSSRTRAKRVFELSLEELQFGVLGGPSYTLIRALGVAADAQVTVQRLPGFGGLLRAGSVRLLGVAPALPV